MSKPNMSKIAPNENETFIILIHFSHIYVL